MRPYRKNVAQHAGPSPVCDFDESVVISKHVPHLHLQVRLYRQRGHTLPCGPVVPGGLVIPGMLAGADNLFGLVQAFVVAALRCDRDDRRITEHILRAFEPADVRVRTVDVFQGGPPLHIGLEHPDALDVWVGQHGLKFAGGMPVTGAVLRHTNRHFTVPLCALTETVSGYREVNAGRGIVKRIRVDMTLDIRSRFRYVRTNLSTIH